jgi:hypothetical protein
MLQMQKTEIKFDTVEDKFPKCCVRFCRNDSATDSKGRKAKRGMCHGHYQAWWRKSNPLMSYYRSIKDHAKKRNIKFTLTYKQLQSIVPDNWMNLTIDRIRAWEGYEWGNIQFLPDRENKAKGNRERRLPKHVQDMRRRKTEEEYEDNCPF